MPVYEYQGQHYDLPDGLSNEQALAKIKSYLGEASAPAATQPAEAPAASSGILPELGRQLGLTARAGVAGLSTVPNAVADFLSGAANLGLMATGSEQRVPYLSQVQQQAMEKTFPTPKPGLEEKVQTATEAVAGMMSPGIKAPMAQKAEDQVARRVATEAAAVATGAVIGEEAAKKAMDLTGSPWAALAAGLATGTVAGSATGKGLFALTGPRTEPVTIEQIRRRASQGYQAVEDAQIAVDSKSIKNKLIPTIKSELVANNYDPTIVSSHKPIEENLKLLDKIISSPTVDFTRLEKVRSAFSSMAQGSDDASRLSKIVTSEIDSYLANLGSKDVTSKAGADPQKSLQTLSKARADWRNQARAQVLQDLLDSSVARIEGATGPTGDIIKRNLVNLTANTEKMKMFSTAEQNVIKAAAKATDLESLLSLIAKFNPQRGYAQSTAAGAAATAAATGTTPMISGVGLLGTALAGGGYAADKALAAMRKREVQDLINQIASGTLKAPKEGFAIPGLFGASIGAQGQ